MRKIILLVLAIILNFNCYNIYSQVIIDPPKLNQLDTLSILQREPDRFVRGWTCGSPGNMLDSAMNINTYYSYHYDYYNATNNNSTHNLLIINRPGHYESYLVAGRDENVAFNTQSLYLEPSLQVDTTQNFKPRANDNTGAAMGFLYRDTVVSNDSIDINGNGYLVLEKNSVTTGSVEVLSNIWKND